MCEWNRWTIIQNLVMSVVINTSAMLLAGVPLVFTTWYPLTSAALATNILAQLLIPTHSIAHALTGWTGEKPWRLYCEIFVENFIFTTIISLTMSFIQAGAEGMIAAWSATYLQLLVIGYVTSVVLVKIGQKLQ